MYRTDTVPDAYAFRPLHSEQIVSSLNVSCSLGSLLFIINPPVVKLLCIVGPIFQTGGSADICYYSTQIFEIQ